MIFRRFIRREVLLLVLLPVLPLVLILRSDHQLRTDGRTQTHHFTLATTPRTTTTEFRTATRLSQNAASSIHIPPLRRGRRESTLGRTASATPAPPTSHSPRNCTRTSQQATAGAISVEVPSLEERTITRASTEITSRFPIFTFSCAR